MSCGGSKWITEYKIKEKTDREGQLVAITYTKRVRCPGCSDCKPSK